MKIKLDENSGTRTQNIFRLAGHDIQTVHDEGLQGFRDSESLRTKKNFRMESERYKIN